MRIYPQYEMKPNSAINKEREFIESQKRAWQAVSDSLPHDAFSDDVVVNDDVGTFRRAETHTISQLFNYNLIS
jgi:hypothetical protein